MRILIALDKAIGVADVAETLKRKPKATQFRKIYRLCLRKSDLFSKTKTETFLFQ